MKLIPIKNFALSSIIIHLNGYILFTLFKNNVYYKIYFIMVAENILISYALSKILYNKHNICETTKKPTLYNSLTLNNIYNFMISSMIDTLEIYYFNIYKTTNILYDIITFIPKMFAFEIIFDLIHYWTHRCGHNRLIYKFVHKKHHNDHHNINILTTFNHSIVDLIFTNFIPVILTSYFINLSEYQMIVFMIYKKIIETSGHMAVFSRSTSFMQCMWIPKILNIELSSYDHYQHHVYSNYNYGKRFSLWDKIFGTYKFNKSIISKKNQILYNDESIKPTIKESDTYNWKLIYIPITTISLYYLSTLSYSIYSQYIFFK